MSGGRWGFDLESNGLLDTIHTIWCIVCREIDTGEVLEYGPSEIKQALDLLSEADEIIGHNILDYDIPAIQIVYPGWTYKGKATDTLVLSRLIYGDLFNDDAERNYDPEKFQKRLWGSHSLKAWGMRLGDFKDDYNGGWEAYSDVMLSYCVQDTKVTDTLYKKLMKTEPSQQSIDLEHSMAVICKEIGSNGWTFDKSKATALYALLAQKRHEIEDSLKDLFEPWTVEEDFYPKRDNKTLNYKAGELFVKSKTVYFNPGSRQHIEKCLKDKYKWKPKEYSPSGQAVINDSVLSKLHYPEAKRLAEFFLIQKRIGMLAEGNGAWLKKVSPDGKLRHRLNSNGCVSSRSTATSPNLQQVPSSNSLYGKECRELFGVPEGWWLCGSDLSGIEVRLLASYLHPYDGGEYAKVILEGDVHQYNADKIGLSRVQSKTWLYATLYGGGDRLIGAIAGGGAKKGKELKDNFDKAVPAFATLKKNLRTAFGRGYIKALDGRKLKVRSEHRCLSQLLQSAGAIVAKQWVMMTHNQIKQKYGADAVIVGFIHDEIQIACKTKEIAENVGNIAGRMAEETGVILGVKVRINSDYTVGRNWSETH
jgi:DNA polymerase-1